MQGRCFSLGNSLRAFFSLFFHAFPRKAASARTPGPPGSGAGAGPNLNIHPALPHLLLQEAGL